MKVDGCCTWDGEQLQNAALQDSNYACAVRAT